MSKYVISNQAKNDLKEIKNYIARSPVIAPLGFAPLNPTYQLIGAIALTKK